MTKASNWLTTFVMLVAVVVAGYFVGSLIGNGGLGGGFVLDPNGSTEAVATAAFEDIQEYWGDYASDHPEQFAYDPSAEFVYVGTDEYVDSGCGAVYGTDYNAYYCNYDDTIYVTATLAEDARNQGGIGAVAYTVAHEYGHNIASEVGAAWMDNPGAELYADYLGGAYFADAVSDGDFTVSDSQGATEWAGYLGDYEYYAADHHGTPQEREEAFVYGYQTGDVVVGLNLYWVF